MDPITIAMLGMGALNAVQNMSKEDRQTKLASATQRYSPWTGNKAQPIEYANPAGDLAQAGGGALAYNQNVDSAQLRKALTMAQISSLNRGGSQPYRNRDAGGTDYWQNGQFNGMS